MNKFNNSKFYFSSCFTFFMIIIMVFTIMLDNVVHVDLFILQYLESICLEISLIFTAYYYCLPSEKKKLLDEGDFEYVIRNNRTKKENSEAYNIITLFLIILIVLVDLIFLFLLIKTILVNKIIIVLLYVFPILFLAIIYVLRVDCDKYSIPVITQSLVNTSLSKRIEIHEPTLLLLDDNVYTLVCYNEREYSWIIKDGLQIIKRPCEAWIFRPISVNENISITGNDIGVYVFRKNYAIFSSIEFNVIFCCLEDNKEKINKLDRIIKKENVVYFFKASKNAYKISSFQETKPGDKIEKNDYGIYFIPYNCVLYNISNETWEFLDSNCEDAYFKSNYGNVLIKTSINNYIMKEIIDLTLRSDNEPIILESSQIDCFKCERIIDSAVRNYYYYDADNNKWLDSREFKIIDDYLYLFKNMNKSLIIVNKRDISIESIKTEMNGIYYVTSENNRVGVYKAESGLVAFKQCGKIYKKCDISSGVILRNQTDSFLFIESGRQVYSAEEEEMVINIGTDIKVTFSILIYICEASKLPDEINDDSIITLNNLRGYISGETDIKSLVNICKNKIITSIKENEELRKKISNSITEAISTYVQIRNMPTKTQVNINQIYIMINIIIANIQSIKNDIADELTKSITTVYESIFKIEPYFTNSSISVTQIDEMVENVKKLKLKPLIQNIENIIIKLCESGYGSYIPSFLSEATGFNVIDTEKIADATTINYNYTNYMFVVNNIEISYDDVQKLYNDYVNDNGFVEFEYFLEIKNIEKYLGTESIGNHIKEENNERE